MCNLLFVVFSVQPFPEVEAFGHVQGDGISLKKIGHEDEVSVLQHSLVTGSP